MNLKKGRVKITKMMINKENAGKVTVEAALQIIIIPLPVTMNRKIKKSTVK